MGWLGQGSVVTKAKVGSVKAARGRQWLHWQGHSSERTTAMTNVSGSTRKIILFLR